MQVFLGGSYAVSFLPFDYLVVSNPHLDSESLKETLSFFHERGIRKFIFLLDFDRTVHTLAQMKDRQKNFNFLLQSIRPRGTFADSFLNLILSDGIVYDPSVASASTKTAPFLFVKAPVLCNSSWVDSDLNYLLYKMHRQPILTCFEGNILTNSQSQIDQMIRSKAYRFSLDLNYITSSDADVRMMQIISREISVFPSISHSLSNYVGIEKAFEQYKERLGNPAYTRLCRNFWNTEKAFFAFV